MEYIYVSFDPASIRDVNANGAVIGQTESTLQVPAGYYTITLSGGGYTPPQWAGPVANTLPGSPMIITFGKSPSVAGAQNA